MLHFDAPISLKVHLPYPVPLRVAVRKEREAKILDLTKTCPNFQWGFAAIQGRKSLVQKPEESRTKLKTISHWHSAITPKDMSQHTKCGSEGKVKLLDMFSKSMLTEKQNKLRERTIKQNKSTSFNYENHKRNRATNFAEKLNTEIKIREYFCRTRTKLGKSVTSQYISSSRIRHLDIFEAVVSGPLSVKTNTWSSTKGKNVISDGYPGNSLDSGKNGNDQSAENKDVGGRSNRMSSASGRFLSSESINFINTFDGNLLVNSDVLKVISGRNETLHADIVNPRPIVTEGDNLYTDDSASSSYDSDDGEEFIGSSFGEAELNKFTDRSRSSFDTIPGSARSRNTWLKGSTNHRGEIFKQILSRHNSHASCASIFGADSMEKRKHSDVAHTIERQKSIVWYETLLGDSIKKIAEKFFVDPFTITSINKSIICDNFHFTEELPEKLLLKLFVNDISMPRMSTHSLRSFTTLGKNI